jgi:membrane protease YdiL (CAAX protease family)
VSGESRLSSPDPIGDGLSAPLEIRREERDPFWGYLDVLIFFGIACAGLFVVILLLLLMMKLIPSLQPSQELVALPAQLLLYIFLYVALWLIIKIKYERPVWLSLGWKPSRLPSWQAFIGGCVLSFAIGLLGSALQAPQIKSPFDRFLHSPGWIVLFGLFAVFLGPVFEEIVFRGFIQPLLSRDLGNVAGILLTAGLFGLLHGPEYSGAWQFVVLITAAGACFGWVRAWTGWLIPAVVMHAGSNAVFFVAALTQNNIQK